MTKRSNTSASPPTEKPAPVIAPRGCLMRKPNSTTLYVTKRGVEVITELAAGGHSNASIARILGINNSTLKAIRQRQPEIDDALIAGRSEMEHEITSLLLEQARSGNVVAAIFLAKARCGWVEGQPREAQKVNISISLPGALTPDAYAKAIDVEGGGEK